MVKLHCDRCGEEIKDRYYTIHFYSYYANPQCVQADYACVYDCSSETRDGALKMLNSQTMYCENCKSKIEKFMSGKE